MTAPEEELWCVVFQMVDGSRIHSEYRNEFNTRAAFEYMLRTWGTTPLIRMRDFRHWDMALVTEHIITIEVLRKES